MSPVAGFVRLRRHLFGRQASAGTVTTAKRAYPFSGVPDVDLAWTDPEVDQGAFDPVAPPTRGAPELTADLDFNVLFYNDLPLIHAGFFGGAEVPTGAGTAQTWVWNPSSTTVDDPDPFTYEFGDDVLTDWYQLGDGMVEDFEITGPEGLGALTASVSWRFGSVASTGSTDMPVTGSVPTGGAGGLAVDIAGTPVYLKDGALYISDSPYDLASNQISDALHTFTLRASHEIDEKRWANGDQSFDADALVPGARAIELEMTFSKTADTVGVGSESDDWMSDVAVNRYVQLVFTSTAEAQSGIPYSWEVTMPMRYYTRTEGEIGGNTVIVLTGHAFYDPNDFGGVYLSEVVNTIDETTL